MPGIRAMLAATPPRAGGRRNFFSADTRRLARALAGCVSRVSSIQAPPQSPYTPLVLAYTSFTGARGAAVQCTLSGTILAASDSAHEARIRRNRPTGATAPRAARKARTRRVL